MALIIEVYMDNYMSNRNRHMCDVEEVKIRKLLEQKCRSLLINHSHRYWLIGTGFLALLILRACRTRRSLDHHSLFLALRVSSSAAE
jgi:hypothetical protein